MNFWTRKKAAFAGLATAMVPGLGVVADVTGILGGDYTFKVADLTMIVYEMPTDEQAAAYQREIAGRYEPGSMSRAEATAIAQEALQIDNIPDEFKSYVIRVHNDSERDASDVEIFFRFMQDDEVVLSDQFSGRHQIDKGGKWVQGAIPMTQLSSEFDHIETCLSYRGRYFVNSVVSTAELHSYTGQIQKDGTHYGEGKAWAPARGKNLDRFVFEDPCGSFKS